MWGIILLVVLGAIALGLWGVFRFEHKQVFRPSRMIESTPDRYGISFEDVVFKADDGTELHGWWIPCENAVGTVLYCHGNAGNIGTREWWFHDLKRLPVNLFLFDYRGYGNSRGKPSERGLHLDALAAWDEVARRHNDTRNPPIVLHGISLGGGVASRLATQRPVRGVVLQSTFTSIPDMSLELYPNLPLDRLSRHHFRNKDTVPKITCPILFAHSEADDLIPYHMGKTLYDTATTNQKRFFDLNGNHVDAGWNNTPGYWDTLSLFILDCIKNGSPFSSPGDPS